MSVNNYGNNNVKLPEVPVKRTVKPPAGYGPLLSRGDRFRMVAFKVPNLQDRAGPVFVRGCAGPHPTGDVR